MDGTTEKAVIDKNDTLVDILFAAKECFDKKFYDAVDESVYTNGITICLLKKVLSDRAGSGTATYNKIVRHAVKVMRKNRAAEAKAEAEQIALNERIEKLRAKRLKKREKKAAEERERQIQIQAEVYARAMKMNAGNKVGDN